MAVLQRLALRGTPKATKAAARYTPAGGAERCGMCRHYVPSSSCARIEGPVSAAGWCQLYSQQVTWRPRAGQAAGGSASLDLSFLAPGALPASLTFTRASTATYFDATGTLQTATTNTPRWDYSPSALTLNGLLIEEARTNSIRNSTATGATPGTPGTPPTNWVISFGPPGLSSQIVGTGTESGIPYCDVRMFGTATGTSIATLLTEGTLAIAALTGQTWSYSNYCRLVAGTFNGITATNFELREVTSAGANVKGNFGPAQTITSAALNSQRAAYTVALSGGGTTAFVQCRVNFSVTNAAVVDITLRIGAPQMEQGPYASSVIPTPVAVTRAADVCSAPIGAWFNAMASSLAADFMVAQTPIPATANTRSPTALSDGSANNRLRLLGQIAGSANAVLATSIANVSTVGASLGTPAANVVSKMAGAWNGTAAVGSLNGAATVSTAVGMPAGLTTLMVGNDFPGSVSYLNGWVRRVRYWNTALSAAELQSVTT